VVPAQVRPRFLSTGPVGGVGGQPRGPVDGRKLCTPHSQGSPGSPQLCPQKYPGSPQANPPPWCDAFHSSGGEAVFRCRTVDRDVEKRSHAVHNGPQPVGGRWTTRSDPQKVSFLSTVCGSRFPTYPQPAELGGPLAGRLPCGGFLDNSGVPRVWTARSPHSCGQVPSGARESNRAGRRGGAPEDRERAARGPFGGRSGREEPREGCSRGSRRGSKGLARGCAVRVGAGLDAARGEPARGSWRASRRRLSS
jgi:hypothetical protein